MAITYSSFLTQIRNYTEVDSNVLTDTLIDQFVRNVEIDVADKIDYDDLRKYADSFFTANNKYLEVPADCLIPRALFVATSGTTATGTVEYLEKRDQTFMREYNNTGSSGVPKYWANWDDFTIIVAPKPSSAFPVQLEYIKDPPHFTSTNNTYLSTYFENILLYGVLGEAFSYLKGPMDLYNLNKTKYDEELQTFALQQMGRRRRGEYDDGVPRIKINSPSPRSIEP
jgi:hypothetical protein